MYECPICKLMPSSHSLQKVCEKKGILYYYTCPSKAIFYNDVKGIIHHYEGMLSEIPENKRWVWIFDSFEFGFMHATNITVAIELAKLINKFSKNLIKIIIINPTMYITMTHKMIMPFLDKLKNLVEINYESTCIDDIFL